jgi:tRNA-2-methylthio-N6-dimethylallyladenosine synthase
MSAPSVYIETYGCQMNVADTEMVLGMLEKAGYARTLDPASADVILINTCSVRERAVERVRGRASSLARYKHQGRPVVLGITGCMAEHLREDLRVKAPYVDLVVGPDSYRRLLEHIETARRGTPVEDTSLDPHETYEGLDSAHGMSCGVIGHVSIQRGCDRFCTFCIVPFTRGRERATHPDEVIRQVRTLAAKGIHEVQLLGQTVNSFCYEETGFDDLLQRVAEVEGIERIRFMSPYPLAFPAKVIATMARLPKICRHIHLPLQSASDSVLERMRRGYRFADYQALISDLRSAMPEIAITSDILVGFCGETEAEFAETQAALSDLQFDNAFLFAYSERQGTLSARRFTDDVPPELKQRRLQALIDDQRRITAAIYRAQVGRRERVLIESPSKKSSSDFLGRTDAYRPVIVSGEEVALGEFIDVLIDRVGPGTLYGRPLTSQGAT